MSATEKTLQEEAETLVTGTAEAEGPHVLADRSEAMYDAIVPPGLPLVDPLAGRIALTLPETQAALGIGKKALATAIRKGEVPTVKVSNRRLVPKRALERHLEALAYAESGALDAWEAALVRAASVRLRRVRREAWGKRKVVRQKMREARRRVSQLSAVEGAPREMAVDAITSMRVVQAELTAEEALASNYGNELAKDIELIADEFGIDLETMEGPRLGLGPK